MTGDERAEVMVRMTFGPNHGIEFSPDGTLLAVCSAQHVEIIDAWLASRSAIRQCRSTCSIAGRATAGSAGSDRPV